MVLANGEIVRLGSRTHKNKTGFDLHRLFVGSEGMLGVVTEATLKLLPLPPFRAALSLGFENIHGATHAIRLIFKAGLLPCALEIADAFTVAAAQKRTASKLLAGCNAHLIVEMDGQKSSARAEIKKLAKLLRGAKPRFVHEALGAEACEKIWQLRREFSQVFDRFRQNFQKIFDIFSRVFLAETETDCAAGEFVAVSERTDDGRRFERTGTAG